MIQYVSPITSYTHIFQTERERYMEKEGEEGKEGGKIRREGKTVSVSFFLLAFLFLTSSFSLAFP